MGGRNVLLIAGIWATLFLGCGAKWPTSVPEALPRGIQLMPLSPGTSWRYWHTVYDSLPGTPRSMETVEWRIGPPVMLNGHEYLPLGECFAVRPAEEGLFFARVDTATRKVHDELLFKTTARRGERYTHTFFAPETTITYQIEFEITPVQGGDCYFGASYFVWGINDSEWPKGPAFLFRPGYYLKAIDRFPAPPFHFWAIQE